MKFPEKAYAYFVTLFALAKKAKDYELADMARGEIRKMQDGLSDGQLIAMHTSGVFRWHPVFVPPQ
jgi:hypothetical protein